MAHRFLRLNLIHRFSTVSPTGSPSTVAPETMFSKPNRKTNGKAFQVTQTMDLSGQTTDPPTTIVPEIFSFDQPKQDVDNHLDLSDQARLFGSVPISNLIRSTVVLHATSIGPMVDLGSWIMSSKLMDTTFTRDLVLRIVKGTFYDHFCAGENAVAAARRVRSMYESTGLKGMLVYGVEHAEDGGECDNNIEKFIETVETAKTLPTSHLSSVVVKITAICPMSVLKRVSDLLRWQYKNPNFKLPWKLNSFPVFSGLSPLYHTTSEPEPLSLQEEQELQKAHERIESICKKCQEYNVPLLIDAEDTILQPAIDYMAYWSATMFNSDKDRPIVYNTIQAYLKDAGERLHLALRELEKMNVPIGFKLVRGAYMASEGKLAESLGYKSPVHDTIQETHACYNECMSFLMEKASNGSGIAVILATHNTDSGKLGAQKASELGIDKENGKIEFAQLYGMSDALSFGLKRAGFNVSKYMPYGPVETAVPYLIRRAYENRGMMSTGALDRQLMRMELKRRIMVG